MRAGAPLFSIDARPFRASLAEAQASAKNAEADYRRKSELVARQLIARTEADLALAARDGGPLRALVDHMVVVPTTRTDRAQEIHLCVQHMICDLVERGLDAG